MVWLAGQALITGAVLSRTVIMNVQVEAFKATSVTVAVTTVVPVVKAEPETGVYDQVNAGDAVQLSVAVPFPQVTASEQLVLPAPVETVWLAGQALMTGTVLSATVTAKVQVEVFREASVTVAVTIVVPELKVDPEAGLYDQARAVEAVQLSAAVPLLQLAVCVQEVLPLPVETVWFAGQLLITGDVLSRMVMVKVQVEKLEEASVTVAVTTVVPEVKVEPDTGL
jgi:hypothetical protein